MHIGVRQLVVVVSLGLVVGCGPTPAPVVCTPGRSEACVGPGGCAGGQQCNAEGTGYGACDCGSMMTVDSGTTTMDAGGTDAGGTDAGVTDSGVDAGPMDPGLSDGGACDPFSRDGGFNGCAAGRKCSWIETGQAPVTGQLGCVPNGTQPVNFMCVRGDAGVDNCVGGTVCIGPVCRPVCDVTNQASCGVDNCVAYSGLYEDSTGTHFGGACVEGCDPLTQLRTSGSPCPSGQGCYLLSNSNGTTSVCANAGTRMHNETIVGTAFANSCVPGAQPRPRFDGGTECGGLCRPADVTVGVNTASEGGVGADSCQTRWGAAAPSDPTNGESCRYYWAAESSSTLTQFSNTVGFCFKHAAWLYDSNGDMTRDAPFPRCTTVTENDLLPPIENPPHNDALYFFCIAKPAMKRAERIAPAPVLKLDVLRR